MVFWGAYMFVTVCVPVGCLHGAYMLAVVYLFMFVYFFVAAVVAVVGVLLTAVVVLPSWLSSFRVVARASC